MKIIVGHSNMDLDCVASLVLARKLFPDHAAVRSHLVHPEARRLMNLYEDRLEFLSPAELTGKRVARAVVVDARSEDRIAEYVRNLAGPVGEYEVFDHHPDVGRDIPGAVVHASPCGANASSLVLSIAERGLDLDEEEATIALAGIYADTGNFLHENVRREDFEAASWLVSRGASLRLVKEFLAPLAERYQVDLFHEILARLEIRDIRGYRFGTCYLELEEDSRGLGAVAEQVFEVERAELLLAFFFFPRKSRLLVVARNSNPEIPLEEIFADLGGGGHRQAASATIKCEEGPQLFRGILGYVERILRPAACAGDLMTESPLVIPVDATLMEASMLLEEHSHTGAPVVDSGGSLVGLLTLRDIMGGRRGNQMRSSVRVFMTKNPVSVRPETTIREIGDLLFERDIGHFPVLREGRLVGIVTRSDYLAWMRDAKRRKSKLLDELGVAQGPAGG